MEDYPSSYHGPTILSWLLHEWLAPLFCFLLLLSSPWSFVAAHTIDTAFHCSLIACHLKLHIWEMSGSPTWKEMVLCDEVRRLKWWSSLKICWGYALIQWESLVLFSKVNSSFYICFVELIKYRAPKINKCLLVLFDVSSFRLEKGRLELLKASNWRLYSLQPFQERPNWTSTSNSLT